MKRILKVNRQHKINIYSEIQALTVCLIIFIQVIFTGCSSGLLPVVGEVPDFSFTELNSEPFGIENLQGRISLVDFIFTRSQTSCPVMAISMGDIYRKFELEKQIQFVSITVDPEHDSLEVLREYAASIGVIDDRWRFLRAPVEDVEKLSEGLMLPVENLPAGHSTSFVLVDKLGRIRGMYDGLNADEMDELSLDLRRLLREKTIRR